MIVITRTDGGVSIMQLVGDADAQMEVDKWKECHVGEYVSHREAPDGELPVDRTKRDAWIDQGGKIEINSKELRK